MNTFRILVADDHPVFRFGVCALLGTHEGWEICGEATDGREAVDQCHKMKPDLVILDICMPKLNGVDAARLILKKNPAQRILILTDVTSDQVIRDCLEAGVRGWVVKSDGVQGLTSAVEALQRHSSVFSPRVSDLMMDGYRQQRSATPTTPKVRQLSPREREVVQLLGEGKTTKEVAMALNVTVKTAETHRSNIMLKLNLHSIAQLVLYAVRNEIVQVPLPTVLHFPASENSRPRVALAGIH
jgi:DNA-binding NarL/FixJ family response regulator